MVINTLSTWQTTKNIFFRLKNGGEEKEISSQTFSFVFCQDWGLQQAGVVEILDDVDHATCLVSTNFFQVEMKPSSTPVLLAVRRRGEDVKGGDITGFIPNGEWDLIGNTIINSIPP